MFDGEVEVAAQREEVGQESRDQATSAMIAERARENLGLPQQREHPVVFAEGTQGIAQVQAQVDRLANGLGALRQVLDRPEGLLEPLDRRTVGRAAERLGAGLAAVDESLVPYLATEGVVGELVHLIAGPVGVEALDGLDDARVERAAPLAEEAAGRDLQGQRVLEDV